MDVVLTVFVTPHTVEARIGCNRAEWLHVARAGVGPVEDCCGGALQERRSAKLDF